MASSLLYSAKDPVFERGGSAVSQSRCHSDRLDRSNPFQMKRISFLVELAHYTAAVIALRAAPDGSS